MTTRRLLFGFYRSHRVLLSLCLLLSVIEALAAPLLSVLAAQAFASVLGYNSLRGALLIPFDRAALPAVAGWVFLLGGLVFLRWGVDWAARYQRAMATEQFVYGLRQQIFEHQLRVDMRQYEERGTGRYLLRFSGDLGALQQWLSRGILQFFGDALFLAVGLVVVGLLAPAVLCGIIPVLILCFCVLRWVNGRITHLEDRRRGSKSTLLAFVSNRLLNMPSIRASNRETPEYKRFLQKAEKIRAASGNFHRWATLSESVSGALPYLLLLAVLAMIGFFQNGSVASTPAVVAAAFVAMSWRPALMRLFRVGLVWKKGRLSLQKLDAFFALSVAEGVDLPDAKKLRGALIVSNLAVEAGGKTLFSNLSFSLEKGGVGLLYAPSGKGKSTLLKVLAGLGRAAAGRILLGAQDLSTLHPKAARRSCAFVSDKLPLYGKTLGEAIAYSRSPEDEAAAAQLLDAWKTLFPALQPLRVEMPLYDPLATLSFGQSRLLIFLRAFLTEKKYLIIDEPFLGLDPVVSSVLAAILNEKRANHGILILTADKDCAVRYGLKSDWELALGTVPK
jgi:ABC-type multidrug transport system fused ATPase/permease subunit